MCDGLLDDDLAVEHVHPTSVLVFARGAGVDGNRVVFVLGQEFIDTEVGEDDLFQTAGSVLAVKCDLSRNPAFEDDGTGGVAPTDGNVDVLLIVRHSGIDGSGGVLAEEPPGNETYRNNGTNRNN